MTTIDFFIELHKRKPFGLTKEVLFFEAYFGEPTPPKNLQLNEQLSFTKHKLFGIMVSVKKVS